VNLNQSQIDALKSYAAKHGRTWKSKLRAFWQRDAIYNEPELRQVRNILGPVGLASFKLPV
jgi:hypothetical protein|tara:strand:- start:1800 stop:1982 length:183 start_codon:yes stop_codon:yes gene_type:complete